MHVRFTLTSRGVPLITNDVLQYFFMMSFNSLITVVSLIVFASRILSLPSIFITKSLTSRSLSPPSILLLIMVVLVLDDSVVLVLDIGDEIVVVTFVVVLVETAVLDRERGVAAKGVTLPVPLARDDLARQRPTPRLDPLYMASWYRPQYGWKSGQGWVCRVLYQACAFCLATGKKLAGFYSNGCKENEFWPFFLRHMRGGISIQKQVHEAPGQ